MNHTTRTNIAPGPALLVTVALGLTLLTNAVTADDRVVKDRAAEEDRVSWRNERGEETEWRGEITAYNARELQLTNSTGRVGKVRADRIVQIQYTRSSGQQSADRQLAAGEYGQAVEAYRTAYAAEPRSWVREELAIGMVRGHLAMQQPAAAARVYLALVADNPQTRFLAAIPLSWLAEVGTDPRQVPPAAWMHDAKQPLAQLISASWALSGAERTAAATVLRELARDRSELVRQLATTQLWRMDVVHATPEQLQRWEAIESTLPNELRGGPAAVLGQGWSRIQQPDAAVLAYLRAAWHPLTSIPLAERCRAEAVRLLKDHGHEDEAARL